MSWAWSSSTLARSPLSSTYGLDTTQVGIVFIVLGAVGVASARTSGRVAARFGPRRVVLLGISCVAESVLVLPSVPILPLALAVFGVRVFGTWFGLPAQQTMAAGLNPRARAFATAPGARSSVVPIGLGALANPSLNSLGWVLADRSPAAYSIPMLIGLMGALASIGLLLGGSLVSPR